ncbi:MAG TPA: hypothetical protein DCX54_10025 [Flavobacteriales bacterium]|nr:hypothetical protein [Flavobacteriales bacterium]
MARNVVVLGKAFDISEIWCQKENTITFTGNELLGIMSISLFNIALFRPGDVDNLTCYLFKNL